VQELAQTLRRLLWTEHDGETCCTIDVLGIRLQVIKHSAVSWMPIENITLILLCEALSRCVDISLQAHHLHVSDKFFVCF
jgi:hypothetical protein